MKSNGFIDNSQIQTFKNCPESYHLKYKYTQGSNGVWLGLAKPDSDVEDHHKDFGSAIHSALQEFYTQLKNKQTINEEAIIEKFSENYPTLLDHSDKAKTPQNGILLIKKYIKRYLEQDSNIEILDVETVDSFEIYPGINFIVKLDLIFKQQGLIFFMDHKTTKMDSRIDSIYWNQYELNSAITAYTTYCIAKYGNCSGGIINALGLGYREKHELFDLEDSNKGWEIYENQEIKYSKYYNKDMMYANGFKCDFQRNLFNRNEKQVESWVVDTLTWIDKIKYEEMSARTNHRKQWTKNESNCRFCSYKEYCLSCADEQIAETIYITKDNKEYLNDNSIKKD